ncbi:ABC transporter ATP-binding protein [bacterium]|nr:ABC transporter ATP-binding protein [bacterium]
MDTVLQIRGLKKSYELGHLRTPALRGVDLTIERGEFTALVGPSGSGKTTLLNIAGCLDVPDEGRVLLAGEEVQNLKSGRRAEIRGRNIGFVFQTFNLIPVLTARENVEYPLILGGHYKRADSGERRRLKKRSVELLKELGLEEYINRRPEDMSAGQRQRVAIARSLVTEPAIILADEPTANVDNKTGAEIMNLLTAMNERHGATFLFATHDPLVMAFCRRIVTLTDGRISDDKKQAGGGGR